MDALSSSMEYARGMMGNNFVSQFSSQNLPVQLAYCSVSSLKLE